MRVTLVCQWYPPEPTPQPAWIATGLRKVGLDVSVLTGVPNYPNGIVVDGYSARRRSSENIDGIQVLRAPLYPSHDASAARRLLNYASWAFSAALLGQRLLRKSDVALVYSSPATAALPAMVAKRLWGTPYVLLVQDVWPDSVFSSGFLDGPFTRVFSWLINSFVRRAYASADHIVVISPGMVDLLVARGLPRSKISLAYNWVEETLREVDAGTARKYRASLGLSPDDFVVMYAGNHGKAQALGSVIEAFGLLGALSRCQLVLVGDGMEKASLKLVASGNPRIHFVDPQPRDAMPDLMAAADVQLVSLADRPLFAVTMPSKVQSILAAGLPLIVSARGDSAAVVEAARAGLASTPEDPWALAAALGELEAMNPTDLRAMGQRGHAYYQREMSRTVGLETLRACLASSVEAREGVGT